MRAKILNSCIMVDTDRFLYHLVLVCLCDVKVCDQSILLLIHRIVPFHKYTHFWFSYLFINLFIRFVLYVYI